MGTDRDLDNGTPPRQHLIPQQPPKGNLKPQSPRVPTRRLQKMGSTKTLSYQPSLHQLFESS